MAKTKGVERGLVIINSGLKSNSQVPIEQFYDENNQVEVEVGDKVDVFLEYYEDGWHGTWAQDGGVTNQQAMHHVDALTWICGDVESVCAISAKR